MIYNICGNYITDVLLCVIVQTNNLSNLQTDLFLSSLNGYFEQYDLDR